MLMPFRVMFANLGDMAPLCGVPSSVGNSFQSKTNPAFRNSLRTCLFIGMFSIGYPWLM